MLKQSAYCAPTITLVPDDKGKYLVMVYNHLHSPSMNAVLTMRCLPGVPTPVSVEFGKVLSQVFNDLLANIPDVLAGHSWIYNPSAPTADCFEEHEGYPTLPAKPLILTN